MENERGQGKSLSSDSTQSKIAQDSISDDVNVEAEKETQENVQSASWDNYILVRHDVLAKNGLINSPRTRISILSGTDVNVDNDFTM